MSDLTVTGGNPRNTVLDAVLAHLSDACSVLECGTRLLECGEGSSGDRHLDEAVCLRQGLNLLREVYDSLDRAIITMNREER